MSPLSIIPPQFKLLAVTAALAGAFGAGWAINGWRLGKEIASIERDHAEAVATANESARLKERAMSKQVEEARNAATKREIDLRRTADASRKSADGLRDELANLRRQLPELAADAARQRADTLAQLFGDCTTEYRGLAEKADRHASDARTLTEAWLK